MNREISLQEEALNHTRILQSAMQGAGGFLEFRALKSGVRAHSIFVPVSADEGALSERLEGLEALSTEGWDIYVGMNPRVRESGTKGDVENYTTLFVDLDTDKAGLDRDDVLSEIGAISEITPDLITETGGGFHVVYFIKPTTDYEAWLAMQSDLHERFKPLGSDQSVVSDSARVLRLTPFPNWKYDREEGGKLTKIARFTSRDVTPSIKTMMDIFEVRRGRATREKLRVPKTFNEGERNTRIFKEASRMRHFGYEPEEMLPTLHALNEFRCVPPLPKSEVERAAWSASRYTPEREIGDFGADIDEINTANLGGLLGDLRKAEYPEREWLIYGLLRGWTGLLIATYDTGKTTLARNIVAMAAIGRPYLNGVVPGDKPLRILFLDFEDTSQMNAEDFDKMSKNFTEKERGMLDENIRIISPLDIDAPDLNLSDADHLKLIEDAAIQHRADLIVIDTLQKAFTLTNENDNSEVGNKLIKPLQRVGKNTNAGILLIHHIGKRSLDEGGASNSEFKARGASAFMNDTKMTIELQKRRGGTTLRYAKIKDKRPKDMVIELDAETRWFELVETGGPVGEEMRDKIARLVCEETSHGHLIATAMSEYGVSESTAKRGIKNALEAGYIAKNDSGKYYRPGCIPFVDVIETSQSIS